MMDLPQHQRLWHILIGCTRQYRVHEREIREEDIGGVVHVITYEPLAHAREAPETETVVDCVLLKIGVDRPKAESYRDEFASLMKPLAGMLEQGPSYITLGAEIGDQGAAFCLMALGQVLGLWRVITPVDLGITGAKAMDAAGLGYVMLSGYKEEVS